jgi:hypothetical protein
MRKHSLVITQVAPLLAGCGLLLAGQSGEARAQVYVLVQVPPAVVAKAKTPTPPATATKKTTIGKNGARINTADKPQDDDMFWEESIDVNGDGTVDEADMLWDDEDNTLFLAETGPFKCKSGGTGSGDVIVALYGQGNTGNHPVGSGWYAVDLDAGECGARAEGLYGCRFDANGNPTACGVAVIDDARDDIVITMEKPAKGR